MFRQHLLDRLCAELDYGKRKELAHLMAEQYNWGGTPGTCYAALCKMLSGERHLPMDAAPLIFRVLGKDVVTPELQLECLRISQGAPGG